MDRELEVRYRDEIEVDNKAEVARGLVDPKDLIKKETTMSFDICGEQGVRFARPDGSSVVLGTADEVTGDYFDNDMGNFSFATLKNFEEFMNIFIDFVSVKTKLYTQADELREEIADLPFRIASYICNKDPEYNKAKKHRGDGFHYHQPLIIAEGACSSQTLIRKVFV